ncbi:MAG: COG1615 family transporter, partial [Oscillatoriales cyanobacterium RM1_1_9]|nr:COG1615 family transporter [Oscillatoriales cyanobacterium RM1_1_9]
EIGADPRLEPDSVLEVSPRVRDSIPIGRPRIYYGELTDTNVMTSTRVQELDYPLGNDNVYNVYDGAGGIVMGQGWKRFLFANRLRNWQMVFTRNFSPETKLLFRRNIMERVKTIAPFLQYDSDPYLVSANANLDQAGTTASQETYLYWILDAYTTSDRYPYSDPGKTGVNYIRNSVKVVVDAYNGSIKFYYLEIPEVDPIITSWRAVFPELFQSIETMPESLRVHIRYPVDLFKVQADRLLVYHMDDPRVFYNREDQWRIPREIYGTESQAVEPYYLIIKLPGAPEEEFIILQPFTPTSRINLIAWLAARSDGEQYGKLLLYRFPKQRLVFGPEQIEALINQKPEISEQISLWNRQGSRAVQGNLLVIPIENSLLYVEPIYLEATENSLPTLARVVVAYNDRIVMRASLQEALRDVFQVEPTTIPVVAPVPPEGN